MNSILTLEERISALVALGMRISSLGSEEKESLARRSHHQNNWFTQDSIFLALDGIAFLLEENNLRKWVSAYTLPELKEPKNVGIIMAGNIPGVGFHDLVSVLISGHKASIKLSSADSFFSTWLIQELTDFEPRLKPFISLEEMLKGKDAYIATGSDNSARYFNYYFGKYPNIIRSNRTSVGILTGSESDQDLEDLGFDIFSYFGLGCRNVSKLFVKNEEILHRLLGILEKYKYVADNHKYLNNYEYNKSIYLVNRVDHLDNGFLLLRESKELVSPIGVLYYEYYEDAPQLIQELESQKNKIQVMVGKRSECPAFIPFGTAQKPAPWDYADKVDTLKFLSSLV
ncbi:acyl-CoA reductase [Algoriphagus mannitolivorans]|uniref:acyl-CoA reductase n=1 Tax=Algoriphagus mannitolivorans TaxID=226504 RepID=UPI0004138938|nr:acyl-CoA reductase [Algoriphagus mannitolivorans]